MSLSPVSADRLAVLRQTRDRALAAPDDAAALAAFARAATDLEDALAEDGHLSTEARHEAGRVARSRYMEIARGMAAGRPGHHVMRRDPAGVEPEPGPAQLVLPDGSAFDAAGFVRRIAGDWEAVAARA